MTPPFFPGLTPPLPLCAAARYHWQFDEMRNAQHSTLMLLYYLHGMYKEARKRMAE